VREHGHRARALGARVVGRQRAAERRTHAQHAEVVGGDERGLHGARGLALAQRDARPAERGDAREHRPLGVERLHVGEAERTRVDRVPVAAPGAEDADEPLRLLHRQRAQEDRADEREDRRIGPDAEGQREGGGRGEAGGACETAQALAQVGEHGDGR
jgi:hypothetical protein